MKFDRPEQVLSKLETEEIHEKLKEEMERESLELNEQRFKVDGDCRIETSAFEKLFKKEEIARNEAVTKDLERKFGEKEDLEKKKHGEILEMAKTIGFNKHWFDGKFVAVRTAKYDDYINGVDNLIIDTKTFEPLAAVDTSTAYKTKARELAEKIKNGGVVKYAYGLSENGPEVKSFKRLPLFIISFTPDEVGEMLENYASKEEQLLDSLRQQSRDFPKLPAMHPGVKAAYERLNATFEELGKQ